MSDPAQRAGALLSVDLDAVAANWRRCQAVAQPARCAAVVKADAYGLGVAPVARALAQAGCARFFVATIDEGIGLREVLPDREILVLNGPLPGTEADFLEHRLIPVLNAPEQLAGWTAFAAAAGRKLPAALHVDTGMARLGLELYDLWQLAADTAALAALDVILVMSHLACADTPGHRLNHGQLSIFHTARSLFPGVEGSLAASSGLFLGADWLADWVRPGAALYGIQPTAAGPNPMLPVVRLEAKILQLRDVDAGDTVGYGATHSITKDTRLATVAAGYADGIFRSLGNRGCGHLGEIEVPLVGRVSMDLIVFDVTEVPADRLQPGAVIELLGPHHTVDDMAKAAGTIGYEVLTALGNRYHRRYLGGGAP